MEGVSMPPLSEGEESTTATAEPEVPQLGEQPSPTEEAVPAVEQEQPEGEEPKGDSETQEQEDEAPSVEQTLEALGEPLAALLEAAPEKTKELLEKLGVGESGGLDEREREFAQREIEQAATDRQSALTKSVQALAAYTPQGIQQAATTWGNELARKVSADAQELLKNQEGDTNLIDSGAIAQEVSGYVGQAILAWSNYQNEQFNSVFTAIEKGVAHGHLTADEKKALREARSKTPIERLIEAWPIYEAAALRSAPAAKGKAEAKKTADELELAKILQNVTQIVGKKNGRTSATEPVASSSGRPTLAQFSAATSVQRAEWEKKGIEPLTE